MSDQSKIRYGTCEDLSLIETLRYEPAQGLIRKEAHLDRIAHSAASLAFEFPQAEIARALDMRLEQTSRIRLELINNGTFEITHAPFEKQAADTQWTIAIAKTLMSSANTLIQHKTSKRDVYQKARAEFPQSDINEVILCNEKGEICEGTITNIFIRAGDDKLLTPHLSCGLLPGIYRKHLLETNQAQEAVLRIDDLRQADEIYVGNSLRELIKAKFAPGALEIGGD